MIVNERGHIEMPGESTEVRTSELHAYYVGNCLHFITLRHLLLPAEGKVVVHSEIHDSEGGYQDFLYEVVERHEAYRCAETMINDAKDYLLEQGVPLDMNSSPLTFLEGLEQALAAGLH